MRIATTVRVFLVLLLASSLAFAGNRGGSSRGGGDRGNRGGDGGGKATRSAPPPSYEDSGGRSSRHPDRTSVREAPAFPRTSPWTGGPSRSREASPRTATPRHESPRNVNPRSATPRYETPRNVSPPSAPERSRSVPRAGPSEDWRSRLELTTPRSGRSDSGPLRTDRGSRTNPFEGARVRTGGADDGFRSAPLADRDDRGRRAVPPAPPRGDDGFRDRADRGSRSPAPDLSDSGRARPERPAPTLRPEEDGARTRGDRGARTGPGPGHDGGFRPAPRGGTERTPEVLRPSGPGGDRDRDRSRDYRGDRRDEPSPGFRTSDGGRVRPADDGGRDRLPSPSDRGDRYRGGTGYRDDRYDDRRHDGSWRRPPRRGEYHTHYHYYYPRYHDYYRRHHHHWTYGAYIGFDWGWYWGYSWSPARWGSWYWPFWWPEPVTLCYVPFGFYYTRPAVWVNEVVVVEQVPVYVREEVPVYVREEVPVPVPSDPLVRTSEYGGAYAAPAPAAEEIPEPLEPVEDGPPVLDAVTEKYLREGSLAFAEARYSEAAESFRLAVISSPAAAAPRFAFGQALIALGDYPYAARVLREAVAMEPAILNAPGSIAGVYRDATEFDRVMAALRTAVLEKRGDPDPLFLLGYQQYLSGDPQAVVTFSRMRERFPSDPSLPVFEPALAKRFPALGELPPAGAK